PGRFSKTNPAFCNARRTAPAVHHVAKVAAGAAMRTNWLNTKGVHMAGFRRGENPSRKKASACTSTSAADFSIRLKTNDKVTAPPSNSKRCTPGNKSGHCCIRLFAKSCNSGAVRCNCCFKSARYKGCASKDTKCNLLLRCASCRQRYQVVKKLLPSPKPVSQ